MTVSARAIANALSFEGKKVGCSQRTGSDWGVTYVLDEKVFEDYPEIRDDPKGTRYQVVLVKLADNEEPVERAAGSQVITPAAPAAPENPNSPVRSKVAPDKRLAQQAGILCESIPFQQFLCERFAWEGDPAEAVRDLCAVNSRSEIVPGSPAARKWDALVGEFEMWKAT